MFLVVTGDGWPEADEDGLRALAREWSGVAEAITVLERALSVPVRVGSRVGWDGPAAEAFTTAGTVLSGRSGEQVTALALGSRGLGRFIEDTGVNVQYLKLMVLGQLVMVAGQIAYLAAMAPATFGASTAAIPALRAAGRAFAVLAVRQLLV